MILDLKTFVDETLDIHMADGMVLHIPKPSQKMVIKILHFRNVDDSTPKDQVDAALAQMTLEILNSNIDGVTFEKESIAAMHEKTQVQIVMAYAEFMAKLQADPITPSHPSREKRSRWAAIRSFFRGSGK